MNLKIRGKVKKHLGRGRKLGYPTANLDVPPDAEEGVFVGYTTFLPSPGDGEGEGERSKKLPSLIFIGAPEMFGDAEKRLEAHVLDFTGDLYGQEITVEVIHKLRDNRKFDSAEALRKQMKFDELAARKYFGL